MTHAGQKYVFGPVPSRRLGRSLGVDIVPFKTCTYDCIYCQLGRTTELTLERKRYVPVSEVLDELWQRLNEEVPPDYITLSGSGEPTLHSEIGKLIDSIKKRTSIPVAVLTNGSLLWEKRVQEALLEADLVVPSLDAGSATTFKQINRPHPKLKFERMVEGLMKFGHVYRGKIWLEVFLLEDLNSMAAELSKVKRYVDAIQPDRIQLNTVVRPAAEEFAVKVPSDRMDEIRELFGEHAEVIVPYERAPVTRKGKIVEENVLMLLQRRPCTLEDIANGLGVHRNEALKSLTKLEESNALRRISIDGLTYYQAV